MTTTTNSVNWFEIGTDDIAATERFYGELFGWSFGADADGTPYRVIDTNVADSVGGGIRATDGTKPGYAIFYVEVADVERTCAEVERAGGKVRQPARTTPLGLVLAHVSDPGGNHFGVYSPPPAG